LQEGVSFSVWQRRSIMNQLHPRPEVTLNATVGVTEPDDTLMEYRAAAGIRFESRMRRKHRINTKAYFDTTKSERIADLGVASPITGR
jgi:hypothetical protein